MSRGRLAGFERGLHIAREFGEPDEVANAEDGRADGKDAAVDHDVAVADELAGRCNTAREAEAEDDVVETAFEQADEAFDPVGLLEGAGVADETAKLLLTQAVVEEKLLLFAKLRGELGEFSIFGLPMLAGRILARGKRTGLAEAGQLKPKGTLHLEFRSVAHSSSFGVRPGERGNCRSQPITGASPKDSRTGNSLLDIRLIWS